MIRVIVAAVFGSAGLLGNPAWGQPVVSHVSPAAAQPGAASDVVLHGSKLGGPLQVWTSFPAQAKLAASEAGAEDEVASRTCTLQVPGDVAVGIGGIVASSPAGVSEVRFLMIDDLVSIADNGQNHSPAQAQRIDIPAAVDGVADGTKFDHYLFSGKKGQRISLEAVAARLGTALDPVVRLRRAGDGSEVALADDDAGLGADARVAIRLPADADYLIEVWDNQYRSGGRYRLRVGDFPLVTVPYPLGGRIGSTRRFTFAGSATEDVAPVTLRVPEPPRGGRLSVAAKFPGGNTSSAASLVASELPEVAEIEPNNAASGATTVAPPVALNGRFDADGDQDYFEFAALKDQKLSFQAISRSLGSPSVARMRIYDAEGNQLAETAVSERDEWTLDFQFPAEGLYRLRVEDLLRRGGPEHAYRVEVRPSAGFDLTIKPEEATRFNPPSTGGAIDLTITCERQGYDGPVELSLVDGADVFRLVNGVVPGGASEHRLIVAVADGAEPGTLRPIRVVGRAVEQHAGPPVVADNLATWRAQYPQMIYPPQWLSGLVFAAVGPQVEPFYSAKLAEPNAAFDRGSGQARLALSLDRKNAEFKDDLTVLVDGLPAGFTAEVKAEEDSYEILIRGPKDAPQGEYPFRVITYAEFEGRGGATVREARLDILALDAEADDDAESDAEGRDS